MQQFYLDLLIRIIGIGSASGLFYKDNTVYVVSDNSAYLYEYHISEKTLEKSILMAPKSGEALENVPKKLKQDFESVCAYKGNLYVFGSASTPSRQNAVVYDLKSKKVIRTHDLAPLHAKMQQAAGIKAADYNIEGSAYNGKNWYFLQRGNGGSGINGLFTIKGDLFSGQYTIHFTPFTLPKIQDVEASFTDVILVDQKLYFLATVENTNSTYNDGEILGSFVGSINRKTMAIDFTQKITDSHKFEGISLYKKDKKSIEFLLCEDNDTDALQSDIYKLSIPLK